MPKRTGPKSIRPAAKKQALQILGKKRLSPTKTQRRAEHATLEKAVGYKIPKLSDVVSKPSRHTIKRRITLYKTERHQLPAGYVPSAFGWSGERAPNEVVVKRTATGESIIIKRITKSGSGKSGGSGGERVSRKTGTMHAKKARAKAARKSGKKGARAGKETRKKKKK